MESCISDRVGIISKIEIVVNPLLSRYCIKVYLIMGLLQPMNMYTTGMLLYVKQNNFFTIITIQTENLRHNVTI